MDTEIQSNAPAQALPPPKVLAEYEQLLPGSTERILQLYLEQQRHRFEVEKSVIISEYRAVRMGQIFALMLSLVAMCAGVYLSVKNIVVPGAILSSSSLCLIVIAFVANRSSRRSQPLNVQSKGRESGEEAH